MADDKADGNPAEDVKVPIIEENEPKQAERPQKNIIPGNCFQVKRISGLYMKSYDCEWLFKLPSLQIGISIGFICVFFICSAALFLRVRLQMVGIVLVIMPLTVKFTVGLAFIGANSMENRRIPTTPLWFEMKIHDNDLWSNIKESIYDTGVCHDLAMTSLKLISYDFSMKKLSSLESGCCRPPADCPLQYVNATFWEKNDKTEIESDLYNPNCDVRKSDRDALCYDCQTCRQG